MRHVDHIGNSAHGAEVGLVGDRAKYKGKYKTSENDQRSGVGSLTHAILQIDSFFLITRCNTTRDPRERIAYRIRGTDDAHELTHPQSWPSQCNAVPSIQCEHLVANDEYLSG
jgi:hypothetical protein